LGGAVVPELAATSTGLTAAGELYWNFGWPGVVVGMYLLGAALSGVWWRAVGSDPRSGLLEMAAFISAITAVWSCVEAAAGSSLALAISAGLFWRVAILIRERVIRQKTSRHAPKLAPTVVIRYV